MAYCPHVDGMDIRVCEYCTNLHCKRKLNAFEEFVSKQWDYLGDVSAEEAYTNYTKMLEKKHKKNYLWLTLSPDKKLRNLLPNEKNTKKLGNWAKEWFEYAMGRWYNGYVFVLEGALKNDHLHLHCVVELKSSHNHAEVLKRSWAKAFPENKLLTTVNLQHKGKRGEYAYLRFDDPKILSDKLSYMNKTIDGDVEGVDLGVHQSGGVFYSQGCGAEQPDETPT